MNQTQQYLEWMPQIIYNHHQSGPAGSVLAGPPYRDPFNYVFDPLLVTSLDAVGAAMSSRLNRENKPGYTQRTGSNYSTWWNGGLRTTGYFHNMIGILVLRFFTSACCIYQSDMSSCPSSFAPVNIFCSCILLV